jgi:hypothetical protein
MLFYILLFMQLHITTSGRVWFLLVTCDIDMILQLPADFYFEDGVLNTYICLLPPPRLTCSCSVSATTLHA